MQLRTSKIGWLLRCVRRVLRSRLTYAASAHAKAYFVLIKPTSHRLWCFPRAFDPSLAPVVLPESLRSIGDLGMPLRLPSQTWIIAHEIVQSFKPGLRHHQQPVALIPGDTSGALHNIGSKSAGLLWFECLRDMLRS